MNFVEALKEVALGKKMRRTNGYWKHTFIARIAFWGTEYLNWYETGSDPTFCRGFQWLPKIDDLLAEDWEVLD